MTELEPIIDRNLAELVKLRHEIHRNPELAYEETGTAQRILSRIEGLPGMQIRTPVATTGIVATLGADKSGACVALRADMDALPIQEEGEEGVERPYRSQVPGRMHACGHDGHITCLVGAAQVLCEIVDELEGPVKFVFQPAEEGGAGARKMCEEGVLEDPPVAAVFGLHGWPALPQGVIALRAGSMLASADRFFIVVKGQGAHAAFPHQGIDPVLIASHVVVALQSIVARNTDPLDSAVVTVARISGGTAENIIPSSVQLSGTLRTLRQETRSMVFEHIERLAQHTASALGGSAEVEFEEGYPALANDERATRFVEQTAADTGGDISCESMEPVMGAEDFAYYAERVPAAFFALGVRPPERSTYPLLHQPDYDFHDDAIRHGVRMHAELARGFWRRW